MKIPKKVKIGGHWYDVVYPYKFRDTTSLDAQSDYALKEIKICGVDRSGNETPQSFIISNFIHEIIHMLDAQSGHNVFVENEPAVVALGEGIFQVLVDNGWLKIE